MSKLSFVRMRGFPGTLSNVPGTFCDTPTNFENDWDQAVDQMTQERACVNMCISMTCVKGCGEINRLSLKK